MSLVIDDNGLTPEIVGEPFKIVGGFRWTAFDEFLRHLCSATACLAVSCPEENDDHRSEIDDWWRLIDSFVSEVVDATRTIDWEEGMTIARELEEHLRRRNEVNLVEPFPESWWRDLERKAARLEAVAITAFPVDPDFSDDDDD